MKNSVKIRRNFSIQPVLDHLSKARKLNPDGSYTLNDFNGFYECESYLTTALEIPGRSMPFVKAVVVKAIAEHQDFTEDSFLRASKKAALELLGRQKRFRVVFPIINVTGVISGRRRLRDFSVDFDLQNRSVYQKVLNGRLELAEKHKDFKREKIFPNSTGAVTLAQVLVDAIHPTEAYYLAESEILTILGLASFSGLSHQTWRMSGGWVRPVSPILLCPMVTVHHETGAIAVDQFWYEEFPSENPPAPLDKERARVVKRNFDFLYSSVSQVPWRREILDYLEQYQRAFSQVNMERTFLDGWKLLEQIVGNSNSSADKMIPMAISHWRERSFLGQVGRHLSVRRNHIAHRKRIDASDEETLAHQVHALVYPLLLTCMKNPFSFDSIEEFRMFCQTGSDTDAIRRRIRVYESALRFRDN